MTKWDIITLKTSVECVECGKMLNEGDQAYNKGMVGSKHYPSCPLESARPEKEKDLIEYSERKDSFYFN